VNIYVGNLSSEVTEDELKAEFQSFGEVSSVTIVKDRMTGQPRGFAFVEMPGKNEGQAAMESLNGKPLKGRNLTVNEARPKTDSRRGGGGGGGGRGGPRGGGRGGFGGGGSGRGSGRRF
jgi:RNA recognition motif-containing protein